MGTLSQISQYKGDENKQDKVSSAGLCSTGKETVFVAVPQASLSQCHGRNKGNFPFLIVFFFKLVRFWISILKIRSQKARPPMFMHWLCEGIF